MSTQAQPTLETAGNSTFDEWRPQGSTPKRERSAGCWSRQGGSDVRGRPSLFRRFFVAQSDDVLLKGLLEATNISVSVVNVAHVAREARQRHQLKPVSATLLGQAFAGATLLASLQKGDTRVNLQLECDGALRGLFIDAGTDGTLRGYVKNNVVDVEMTGSFRWRGALGNSGFLSVLRDIGHEYYRSSVELTAFSLPDDLNHFFDTSEQVSTRVALGCVARNEEPLGLVMGVLIQAMPDGDAAAFQRLGHSIQGLLDDALKDTTINSAHDVWNRLFPGLSPSRRIAQRFQCTCSKAKTLDLLASLGATQVQEIIDSTGSTSVTCHFCATKYEASLPDLMRILDSLKRDGHKN